MARSKLKTLKPLREVQCYTIEQVLANATASWNRIWDLVDAVKQSLHTTDIEGFSEPQLEKALQACLDNGDFGEERKK